MKRVAASVAFALAGWLAGCGGAASPTTVGTTPTPLATPAPRATVVIVSIDGLRGDAVPLLAPANISALIKKGAFTFQAQTIIPSNTLPAHTSMLTGYLPSRHGVTWDDYLPANGVIKVPTIFLAARNAGLRTALVAGKEKFNTLRDTREIDMFVGGPRADADVADQAVAQLLTRVDLLFVHFPDVDLSGHATSWMSSSYKDRVTTVDAAVGRIVNSFPENTTLILTADHGGHASGHGSTDSLDMSIPWVIVGPRIRPGFALSSPVSTTDTAATAAFILGITLPPDANGKPVLEAFIR
jgi:predicted AlkP superfamily pyrophosphatase or phosphodiesterase